ncbi:MAG: hypothetical protein ACP5T5_06065 [Thermoprotei archaeon]
MAERVFAVYRVPTEQVGGNSYLIFMGDEDIVVDTGTPGNGNKILKEVSSPGGIRSQRPCRSGRQRGPEGIK